MTQLGKIKAQLALRMWHRQRVTHMLCIAEDKQASAEFFAKILGLEVKGAAGPFVQVQVNDSLTLDFVDAAGG